MTPPKKNMVRERPAAVLAKVGADEPNIPPEEFRRELMAWYREHARELPWRGTTDPYRIWVSEIMLQQTRVAAVIEHYNEFLRRFPTLVSLALAAEQDVLAAWSGLGYYRRARMLHKAAQFIVLEREGQFPASAAELRTLPGIGDYTAAAIASIAFGEPVAVVDGNVERVILRLTGRVDEATAAVKNFIREQAQELMPKQPMPERRDGKDSEEKESKSRGLNRWDAGERIALAASVRPTAPVGGAEPRSRPLENEAGEHNQAMMELGATVCVPKGPKCQQCPVYALCKTRGEHATPKKAKQRSVPAAYLLDLRKRRTMIEVLLERRSDGGSLMPGMYELPQLSMDVVEGREPVLRLRHSITNTNYYVEVFAARRDEPRSGGARTKKETSLRKAAPLKERDTVWVRTTRLPSVPITGLTRKILQRLHVMQSSRITLLE